MVAIRDAAAESTILREDQRRIRYSVKYSRTAERTGLQRLLEMLVLLSEHGNKQELIFRARETDIQNPLSKWDARRMRVCYEDVSVMTRPSV